MGILADFLWATSLLFLSLNQNQKMSLYGVNSQYGNICQLESLEYSLLQAFYAFISLVGKFISIMLIPNLTNKHDLIIFFLILNK